MRTLLASLATLVVLVSGCATTRAYEQRLEKWVGKPADTLVAKWGQPNQTIPLESGRKILEYKRMNEEHGNLNTPRQVAAEKKGAPPVGCKTQFLVSAEGTVERWKWVGDDCVSK